MRKTKKSIRSICIVAAAFFAALLIGGAVYLTQTPNLSDGRKIEVGVLEHRENELVFSVSFDDYIDRYNGFYLETHPKPYLLPKSCWRVQRLDAAVHSDHETVSYTFTENETRPAFPTISVYLPSDADFIQEVTVNFDWHSYTETMHRSYEEMCLDTLKVFLPELSGEQLTELVRTANRVGYDHAFASDAWYGRGAVPYALYYHGNVAVYPYFAIGSRQRLCVIPVTEETLGEFRRKGVAVYEISEL